MRRSVTWCRLLCSAVLMSSLSLSCGDPQNPDGEVAGIAAGVTFASPQNAVLLGDTLAVALWYIDSLDLPLGIRPTDVRWTSSDTSLLKPAGQDAFLGVDLGTAVIRGEVQIAGRTLATERTFTVVPPIPGRLAWMRQDGIRDPVRLVWSPSLPVQPRAAVSVGHPDAPQGLPAFSPSGRLVVVQSARETSPSAAIALYLVDLNTNTGTELTAGVPGFQVAARWMSDGSAIVFSANANGAWDLWSVSVTGDSARLRVQLNQRLPVFFDVARSDNAIILSLPTPEGGQELWEAGLDQGVTRQITTTPTGFKTNPRVSPDGSRVAFTSSDAATATTVRIVSRATGEELFSLPPLVVPGFASVGGDPFVTNADVSAWSSNGQYLFVDWQADATRVALAEPPDQWVYRGDIYAIDPIRNLVIRITRWPAADIQADHMN